MKIGTKITIRNMPKVNGRPQMWVTFWYGPVSGEVARLRIIYPSGHVEYMDAGAIFSRKNFSSGCTSQATQRLAMTDCLDYSSNLCSIADERPPTYFMGYL